MVCTVAELTSVPVDECDPVRHFSWWTGQRHRPGLQYVVPTDRHHGYESHAEQRMLLALEFAGGLLEVLSQPFRLRYQTTDGAHDHTPDFLAWTRSGPWLIDVKPTRGTRPEDHVAFAASAEMALAAGWRYAVVPGLLPQIFVNLDDLSGQRRPLEDPLGLIGQLLDVADSGPLSFGELVAATSVEAIGRAFARHLLWHRRLGMDLTRPLNDAAIIRPTRVIV